MTDWDSEVESELTTLVARVVDHDAPKPARTAAWHQFLTRVTPFVERWVSGNFVLRSYGLTAEDDQRAVLVAVIGRLHRRGFASLQSFLDRATPHAASAQGAATVERGARLVNLTWGAEDERPPDSPDDPAMAEGTPLRAWLLTATRFAVGDHVRTKLGTVRDDAKRTASKRKVNTEADGLDARPDEGERPPMTDWVVLRGFFREVESYIDELPEQQRVALRMWIEGHPFKAIADSTRSTPPRARALVRAVTARLRYRFADHRAKLDGLDLAPRA
ncbi:MAG: hypothetical protein AAF799_29575 [Myxococcota bacterium]